MPIYAPDGIDTLEDYSAQCCEWALMGLCDRNWQRIRQLCPKSCGHLICATIDDALLCNRAIDVDMLDCYKRKIRAYAASNRIPNVPEDTSFKEKYEKKSQNDKRKTGNYLKNEQPVYSRAYAIENELRSYHSLGDF
uniref:ShKT domain-containing protein n=1 Tax=Acrobeloides nanus TaxID=290746 RepID=A0A914D3S5_9BILA